jgi:Mor family transcriptional regulator
MNDTIEPKKKKQNIEQLFMDFNTMENLEDKIKCYKLIVSTINNIERGLFSE